MANRYWVGGTGTWDGSDTSHWSASSGGSAGASVPTSSDSVYIDSSSGSGTITKSGGDCGSLDCTGYTGTLAGTVTASTGGITLSSGGTYTGLSLLLVGGSFDPVGKSVSEVWIIGDNVFNTSVSVTSAMTVTGALTFSISGANKAVTLTLKNGVTHTVGSVSATSQPADKNNTLQSSVSGSQATLSDASGTNTLSYVTMKDIAFTGGATWVASTGCTDGGNNTGITGLPSAGSSSIDALFALSLA